MTLGYLGGKIKKEKDMKGSVASGSISTQQGREKLSSCQTEDVVPSHQGRSALSKRLFQFGEIIPGEKVPSHQGRSALSKCDNRPISL